MSYVRRPSTSLQNWGIGLATWGTIFTVISFAIPMFASPGSDLSAIGACKSISILLLITGLLMFGAYHSFYEVPRGYVMVYGRDRTDTEGWHLGLLPSSQSLVSTERRLVEVSGIEVETPDEGILKASVTVSYTPEFTNVQAQQHFQNSESLNKVVGHRVRSGLNKWIMGKPLPGTLKKALTMQDQAEQYLRDRVVGTSTELALLDDPALYLGTGIPVSDLGIRVYEVNLITWQPIADGTGKPDWGDGDHVYFDAALIRKQLHAQAENLNKLRELKNSLMEAYPEEADGIEDMYDQERMSIKETRERH